MLTEDEKEQIRQQELYRYEVRQQLDSKPTYRSRLWKSLNSAFVLWMLSTVVVGLISFAYTRWEKQRELHRIVAEQAAIKKREDGLTLRKVDAEIASRLAYVHSVIRLSNPSHEAFISALRTLEDPSREPYAVSVFPEYSKRSLRSLVWELLQVLPEDVSGDERQLVLVAYDRARLLPTIYALATASSKKSGDASPPDAARANLETVMLKFFDLERWGKPFTWEKHGKRLALPGKARD